jgi:hypothetical protein
MADEQEKQTTDTPAPAAPAQQHYFFPTHLKTIVASSLEEAHKALASFIKGTK